MDLRAEQGNHLLLYRAQVDQFPEHNLPILVNEQNIQSLKHLKDPTNVWGLGRFSQLVGQCNVHHLQRVTQFPFSQGLNQERQPFLAAGTVLAMVNTPFILYHSEKLIDPDLRDRMVEEVLVAAMGYLKASYPD